MSIQDIISHLEEEIEDPEEEAFLLFSRHIASENLGFIDPKAQSVELTVAGRDFTIHQSPGVLSSDRAGGTTGAVLWKITPLFASYISLPQTPLAPLIAPQSTILELGCGISPLTGLCLSPRIAHYILTDQPYVQKLNTLNIAENPPSATTAKKTRKAKGRSRDGETVSGSIARNNNDNIVFKDLDWETDDVTPSLSPTGDFDLIIACDCIYNDNLVRPLVETCADACRLRQTQRNDGSEADQPIPTVCVVAQQLRSDDVFQLWLTEFHKRFHVWRFPEESLPEGLRPDDGFVIHAGILRS